MSEAFDVNVVLVDAARARFFVDRYVPDPPQRAGRRLEEVADLVNPAARLSDEETFTESRPGTQRAPAGASAHGMSDHREAHRDENDKRFAAIIVEHAERLCKGEGAPRLLVAADPRMLGFLRPLTERLGKSGIEVRDVAKDLSRMVPDQAREVLVKGDLLPWAP